MSLVFLLRYGIIYLLISDAKHGIERYLYLFRRK